MELQTPLNPNKTQIDRVSRFEYDQGVIKVYFMTAIQVGTERIPETFDTSKPVTLTVVENIEECVNIIISEAFKARSLQIKSLSESIVSEPPNYREFYSELLTTELFAITRQKADENLQINTAYTDFAVALTHGVVGNPNPIALQICLNIMLDVLGDSLQQRQLEELDNLLSKYKLPLSRNAAITAQSDDNVVTNN